jgi:hypothetical protein
MGGRIRLVEVENGLEENEIKSLEPGDLVLLNNGNETIWVSIANVFSYSRILGIIVSHLQKNLNYSFADTIEFGIKHIGATYTFRKQLNQTISSIHVYHQALDV